MDPLRHHKEAQAKHADTQNVIGDSFMERLAEKTASGMGTVQFVVIGSIIIVAWVLINNAIPYAEETIKHLAKGKPFDPVPWILLNLIFSGVAFYTGALVIIAAKAEAKKTNATAEAEAKHREELNEKLVELLEANTKLTDADVALTKEVHAQICVPPKPKAAK